MNLLAGLLWLRPPILYDFHDLPPPPKGQNGQIIWLILVKNVIFSNNINNNWFILCLDSKM